MGPERDDADRRADTNSLCDGVGKQKGLTKHHYSLNDTSGYCQLDR